MSEGIEDLGKTHRISVRIPRKQWERMVRYGEVLGLDSDSAIVKHFLNLGLQAGGAQLAAQMATDTNAQMLLEFQAFKQLVVDAEDRHQAEQMDLVKEAQKASSN